MRRFCGLIAALLVVLPALSQSPDPASNKSIKGPREVDMTFANGSNVRMMLTESALDVQTPYGKLSVPVKDIKHIDFGVHLPDGIETKLNQAMEKLAGDDFRGRDAATAELIRLGAHAYPSVLQASASDNLELAKRAKTIVQTLKTKLPPRDLRTQPEDTLVTPTFTIVGRILTPSIKAQAEYFGEVQLPLVQLRTLRSTDAPTDVTITVDASRYCRQQGDDWLATDFTVDARLRLAVTATGQVDLWPQNPGGPYVVGPRGYGGAVPGGFVAAGVARTMRANPGALLGKVGEQGKVFVIGDHYEGAPGEEGKLYLQISPSRWSSDTNGGYQVKISAKR